MRRAIELAQRADKFVANNPKVGAVIVANDKIIGEGWHQKYGRDHAEIMALKSVPVAEKHLLSEAAMYVTLEPCAHYGKTPPCANALVKAGIPKVFVAVLDPSEKVRGKGIAILNAGGVQVEIGLLHKEAKALADYFFITQSLNRPKIILKYAQSMDGYMGKKNESIWITNQFSKRLVHKLRAKIGAIMVGTNTAEIDDPELSTRFGFGPHPLRIIVDKNLRLKNSLKIFERDNGSTQPTLIFTQRDDFQASNEFTEYIHFKAKIDFFPTLFKTLEAKKINTLLVEGGPTLLQSFINAGFWDEAWIFTGDAEIKNGIASPNLKASELSHSATIGTDKIEVYENNSPKALGIVNEG